jgi:poly(3-hydroxybutyrate) depolymerase
VTVDPQFQPLFSTRRYFTRPPAGYDPNTAYPLTIWGQGCGQTMAENTPLAQGPAAGASVMVQMLAKATFPGKGACYSAGPDGDNANSPELPYFDLAVAQATAEFCIDETKIFMGGYSSGGWFTSLVSCNRANVVRGVAWVAAGLQINHAPCMGPVAGMVTVATVDPGTPMAEAIAGRDSLIMRNGCTMNTMPWDPGETTFNASSCVEYQGCMPGYPVVWCPTTSGHSNGLDTGLSNKGFWKFWSMLP